MRLDRFMTETNTATRSQAKEYIKKGMVSVNDSIVKKPDAKIDEKKDRICFQNKEIRYEPFLYYMLNKPSGVVSATEDKKDKTVLDLLQKENIKNLFPVGRLDKDTEGLLLITNDGALAHALLSPKKHVTKTYYVKTRDAVSDIDCHKLEEGVDIGEEKKTLPAKIKREASAYEIYLSITEGKFHQIKRMLEAVDNQVIYLKRLTMGSLVLDETLLPGEYRRLTEKEIQDLKGEEI